MKTKFSIFILLVFLSVGCSKNNNLERPEGTVDNTDNNSDDQNDDTPIVYADIDFSNWKVTLPVDEDNNGKPDEYQPSELNNFGYQDLDEVQPYMYDDPEDSSLVFYTFPDISTANSSYSRTELRELINPSNSKENWTLLEGGEMTGRLKLQSISENNNSGDDYHKVIVMQIHGIISEEDMATYGFDGNNGPPLIKIYWKDGFVWCHKKSLADESTTGFDLYGVYDGTWTDIKVNLGYVGYDPFDFRITASDARIEVQLNDDQPYIYEDISLEKWPFENYFKAGNYLTTTDENAFAYVKYYNLYVTH
ncbi:polysaccharide lyase family 7 protein [Winogradskyella poriferorum]|uniref:polysaccharide lyase family 7 protein n=1 Tax=Winogradskyella poriferorum TaxID=307627 RepID=UPI003D660142